MQDQGLPREFVMSDAPDWFWKAVETPVTDGQVTVNDCDIHFQSWSDAGKPGLLFVHGHNAHAHWWDFVAPFFQSHFHTAALDLSGMGDSHHRDDYDSETYAEEIIAVLDALSMPEDTIVVAHSFGGAMALPAVAANSDRVGGLVLVDSGVRHPDDVKEREENQEPERLPRSKIYPEREVAIARFRLQPPQQCDNQYVVDHIARHSVEYEDGGWVWKFDEEQSLRMTYEGDLENSLSEINVPIALIYGEDSASYSRRSAEYMQSLKPTMNLFPISNAQHHVFLDQPLAFIQTLAVILKDWGRNIPSAELLNP